MKPIILTHGGVAAPNEWSDGCAAAARRGAREFQSAGPDAALRAVIEAAVVLEDDPRFNAGTGSNLRVNGSIQQDAVVATSDGRIGAVACLEDTKNPVRVARLVMDSPHVLLCGDGATRFAREHGFPAFNCSTPERVQNLNQALERLHTGTLKPAEWRWKGRDVSRSAPAGRDLTGTGTIGAVARDGQGHFAVACSTGGTSLMLRGRVGDSPIFGAGVMVGPHGAVCATGHGEEIIRHLCSVRCYDRLVRGESAQGAADATVAAFPEPYSLGLIVVSRDGHGIAATGGVMASFALEV